MNSAAVSRGSVCPQLLQRLDEALRLLCRRLEQNLEQQTRLERFVSLTQDRWENQSYQFYQQIQQVEATIGTWLAASNTPRLAVVPVNTESR